MTLPKLRLELVILTALAFITRFWGLFHPNAVVFDEVYFKQFAGDYLTGSYYFDIHPPLGKLILGGWAAITHQSAAALISPTTPDPVMRVIPALAGALIIPVFYLFLRQLRASRKVATLGATLLLLDNALLVESRFTLIDSLLVLFGLGGVTLFLAAHRARQRYQRMVLIGLSGLVCGLAGSTKWTGLTALGLVGLAWLVEAIRRGRHQARLPLIGELGLLTILPFMVYAGVFWIHFALLPNSGPGDAFMPQRFQATLVGNAAYNPDIHEGFWQKFNDLNLEMEDAETSLKTATHPYSSRWYTWPIMKRTVYYWQGPVATDGKQGNIYLLGNPVVWWGILAGFFILIMAGWAEARRKLRPYRTILGFLAIGYIINFLPFSQIVRVMFLYHYFFALLYSLAFVTIGIGALAGWMDDDQDAWHFSSRTSMYAYTGIVGAALIAFVYFSPLSYGIAISPTQLANRMWLTSWR